MRVSLTREELYVIRDVLSDQMLRLDDAQHQAEDDSDEESAKVIRAYWTLLERIIDRVSAALAASPSEREA